MKCAGCLFEIRVCLLVKKKGVKPNIVELVPKTTKIKFMRMSTANNIVGWPFFVVGRMSLVSVTKGGGSERPKYGVKDNFSRVDRCRQLIAGG